MRKPLYSGILASLVLIGISMACRLLSFTQILQPETETPTPVPISSPTETETPPPTLSPANTAILSPTEFVALVPTTPKFAPFCQPSSASVATPIACQEPIAEQSSVFCSSKTPYNLILINEGSTYETLNEDIECSDAGMKDGKQMLTCTGPMVTSFELKVCDPSCAIQPFPAGTMECPQDLHYNELLRCCEREPVPIDGNCVTLKLQTKSCVIECGEFIDQTTCDKNAYACKWDGEKSVCQRKR
jgi:hypothetical protein